MLQQTFHSVTLHPTTGTLHGLLHAEEGRYLGFSDLKFCEISPTAALAYSIVFLVEKERGLFVFLT